LDACGRWKQSVPAVSFRGDRIMISEIINKIAVGVIIAGLLIMVIVLIYIKIDDPAGRRSGGGGSRNIEQIEEMII
jgi:hypothetical protein